MSSNLLYVHAKNLELKKKDKSSNTYRRIYKEVEDFYQKEYMPMRQKAESFNFCVNDRKTFEDAAKLFSEYYQKLKDFTKKHKIDSRSKVESTFLEEISTYLFKETSKIKNHQLGIYNKKIYAGVKLIDENKVGFITKDVDFCIGKQVKFKIGDNESIIVLPVVAVEVKTYLDATMFGEVKSSSRSIKNAVPLANTYVFMGYKCLKDEHIISARQEGILSEMFVLSKDEKLIIDKDVLYDYWNEITTVLAGVAVNESLKTPGRLLYPKK